MKHSFESTELTLVNSPLIGALHVPRTDTPRLVVCIGGSDGSTSRLVARSLAREGFATAAIEYYGQLGLPPKLTEIPLEYFMDAIGWLRERVRPAQDFVALRGHSRGGQCALILGALGLDASAIIAYVPSATTGWTTDTRTGAKSPTWLWNGAPVPWTFDPTRPSHGGDEIPVERITSPLLLFSATDDQQWPSHESCLRIVDRLEASPTRPPYEHVSYPEAGHG